MERHYTGIYRVKAHYDLETLDFPRDEAGGVDSENDEQYIPCKRGEIRHTYRNTRGKDSLVWYCDNIRTGLTVYNELKERFPDIDWEVDEDLGFGKEDIYCNLGRKKDVMIYFEAENIYTLDNNSEFVMDFLVTLAEEERRMKSQIMMESFI